MILEKTWIESLVLLALDKGGSVKPRQLDSGDLVMWRKGPLQLFFFLCLPDIC